MQILGERLAELDHLFSNAIGDLELSIDQGIAQDSSITQLGEDYRQQRQEIEAALDAAIVDSDGLRRFCIATGLLPVASSIIGSASLLAADKSSQASRESNDLNVMLSGHSAVLPVNNNIAQSISLQAHAILSRMGRWTESSALPSGNQIPDLELARARVAAWIATTHSEPGLDSPSRPEIDVASGLHRLAWLLETPTVGARELHSRPRLCQSMPDLGSR